jgi:hypothetical protein
VRLSIVALVPPSRGVRATLASNGISRVVTPSDDTFSETVLRRDPSVIAFTAPVDATGVFTIDLQPDMLLPFEGSGVDTTWQLSLPQAANPFNFDTISDVLVTIDYTALLDYGYQTEVLRQLNSNRTRSGELLLSLARDFPDQWYALNNPDPATVATAPRTATVTVDPRDIPGNIDPASLGTNNLAIRLFASGTVSNIPVTIGHAGYTATPTTDGTGTASTRRGGNWAANLESTPTTGDWTISFAPADGQDLFGSAGLDDIVLAISWSGQAPVWPA